MLSPGLPPPASFHRSGRTNTMQRFAAIPVPQGGAQRFLLAAADRRFARAASNAQEPHMSSTVLVSHADVGVKIDIGNVRKM